MAARGGQLGNDNASKGTPWRQALNRAIAQDDGKRLRKAAETLLDLAAAGEAWAVKELGDRIDGKAPQPVDVSGDMELTVNVVSFEAGGGNNPTP